MITEHVIMTNIANFQGELLKKLHEQETILNLFNNFFYDLLHKWTKKCHDFQEFVTQMLAQFGPKKVRLL